MKADEFITVIRDDAVVDAIKAAESRTGGEIRVFVSNQGVDDAISEAREAFRRLKMDRTAHRNGLLIFVAPSAKKFAIIGDEGIHRHCQDAFWQKLASELADGFKAGDYTAALVRVIQEAGQALAHHFPGRHDDVNELPNTIARD